MSEVTLKKSIKPITLTIVVEAHKVNENGTLLSLKPVSVKSGIKALDANLKLTLPNYGHSGQVLIQTASLDGLELIEGAQPKEAAPKVKLFKK